MNNNIELLEKLKSSSHIIPLDLHLALFFAEKSNLIHSTEQLRFAFLIAWLSVEVRSGHVCIDLTEITKQNLGYRFGYELTDAIFDKLDYPKIEDWLSLCINVDSQIISDGQVLSPFILKSNRLYFQRMWLYETQVAHYFINAMQQRYYPNKQKVRKLLNNLFPPDIDSNEIDWQKVAVVTAATRRVTIISGGPGTGKTTTISKILAVLTAIHNDESVSPLRIIAAAPTGKAAARLTESLTAAIATLPIEQKIKDSLPIDAVTLHRLLGARIDNNEYLYNKKNKLNVDILLIDEASMVDLSMMSKVIAALPDNTRLILLGDKEQLSSVEAGAVFGDLCELIDDGYSQEHVQMINEFTGYHLATDNQIASCADSVCLLQKSYRFDRYSGIGILANAIKEGLQDDIMSLFAGRQFSDIAFNALNNTNEYHHVVDSCVQSYQLYLKEINKDSTNIRHILLAFSQFRLLCALREGVFGVLGLNKVIENALHKKGYISLKKNDLWYIGRPIMILKNSFSLGLFNGDIGIVLPSPMDSSKLRVYFLMPNGEIKGFSPFRLPEHETTYAMTIHKSQGSEFEQVAVILPNEYSPLLTRSLLYTAVTRAKKYVAIYSSEKILERTVKSQTSRQSGLLELLQESK